MDTTVTAAMDLGLSEKQRAIRSTGIGASEVAAVVGLVPGAIDVWARKVGVAQADDEPSTLSEFGHRIERVIGEAWADRHPGRAIFTPGTLRHPTRAWALASPDRVVVPVGRRARETWEQLLEIKVAFFSGRDYGDAGTDEVPEKHLVQVAWQLMVTGLERATLVALVNGDYREFPIVRDPELEGMLVEQVGRWWRDHVEARVPPPVDGSDAYAAYLRRRYPADHQPPLDPTPELEQLVGRLREARAALKAAESDETAAANALKAALGDAAGVAGLCTWRANRPSQRTDWEALAVELGAEIPAELIVKHTTTKPGARVLRLTKETTR